MLAGVAQHVDFTGHIHVHDIQCRLRLGRQGAGSQGGLDRAPGRPGFGMPFGRQVVCRQGFGNERFDHVPVFGVQQHQHAVVACDPQGPEDVPIR